MEGKLKHSLKERCPECNSTLQVRTKYEISMRKGIEISIPKQFIRCSNENCKYERSMEQKRRRRIKEISLPEPSLSFKRR